MKDSLKISESLIMDGKKLTINNKSSGRLIGEVLIEEFDENGTNIFSNTTYNDISLPGSIFVLEQIFKKASTSSYRFLHNADMPVGIYGSNLSKTLENIDGTTFKWNNLVNVTADDMNKYISDEYIFGFMVGHGGETSTSIISPKYESSSLCDTNSVSSFLPIRSLSSSELDPVDEGINYYIKYTNPDDGKKYFYAKGFTSEPKIYIKWSDGSGDVKPGQLDHDIPILTYAEIVLDINESDIRDYFLATNSEQCYINQLGLVAGKPIWVEDPKGTYKKVDDNYIAIDSDDKDNIRYRLDFDDVKLVTTLNFKSKDLSSDGNIIKFTYKVYCL